jgi:hypothetical protein
MIIVMRDGKVVSRQSASSVSQYNGEKTGGELKYWNLFGTDPVDFVRESYGLLASRCATLYQISAVARACVKKPLMYSIGDGLLFKSLPDHRYLGISEEAAREWGQEFTRLLHYEKKAIRYYKKQKQIAKEAKITGDSVLYFLRDGAPLGSPFDIVVTGGDAIDWEKSDAREYTLGIKRDQYGRRLGFWSTTAQSLVPFKDENGDQVAVQFLYPDRAGQLRGFSAFSSEIARSKNLDRIWDATLERMIQEATQIGYFNASKTDVNAQARDLARQLVDGSGQGADGTSLKELSGPVPNKVGGMYVLENEESMQFNDMKSPGNNFGTANEWTVNMFGMATGIPPEVIMGKYSTSYTAHKGALNDFWKMVIDERTDFVDGVDRVVNLEYLKHFARTGQLEVVPEFWENEKIQLAYLAGTTLGPVPGHVNPLQEVKADAEAVAQGFTLRSNVASKHGNDFDNMVETWAQENERWAAASPEAKAAQIIEAEMQGETDGDQN